MLVIYAYGSLKMVGLSVILLVVLFAMIFVRILMYASAVSLIIK